MTLLVAMVASLAILLAVFWLLFGSPKPESNSALDALEIEKLLPRHCRHFPQISQMLKDDDRKFMLKVAPRDVEKQWRAERRHILRLFLKGLAQDFGRLQRLARLISALSPEIQKSQEWEWIWLGVQFRVLYRMLAVRIALGDFSPVQLTRLTDLVSGLASQLEGQMSLLTEYFPSHLRASPEG